MITMVDERIGKALATAVYATGRQISICQVVQQAARQGLQPHDFDNPTGADALTAIALALTPTIAMPQLPHGWESAVDAALRIVSKGVPTLKQRRAEHRRAELHVARLRRTG